MKPKAANIVVVLGILAGSLLTSAPLRAQVADATLSGSVADPSGKGVPNAKVSVTNVATAQTVEAQTEASGLYKIEKLVPGNYEVSVSAAGLGGKAVHMTLTAGSSQTLDLTLSAPPAQPAAPGNQPATAPADNLPNAPSSSTKEPSLEDLGFPAAQTQGNAKQQALLDKRTHMLKIHQRMGLITTIPLLAAILSSPAAGGRSTSTSGRYVHLGLGAAAGDLYGITAYYAIRAPKIPGTETRGPIRLHKALAWVHGPGMILTPILGAIAYDQKSKGERIHGIAAAHLPVAIVTAAAFGAALMSVSFKF
jgi:Carboxypeptidase regulatory-like domain